MDNTIQDALGTVNEANLSTEELEAQYKRREFISMQRLALIKADEDGISKGVEQGMRQGIEQGIEQGKLEKQQQIAHNLLDILDDETIANKTGLAVKQIQALRDRVK